MPYFLISFRVVTRLASTKDRVQCPQVNAGFRTKRDAPSKSKENPTICTVRSDINAARLINIVAHSCGSVMFGVYWVDRLNHLVKVKAGQVGKEKTEKSIGDIWDLKKCSKKIPSEPIFYA